MESNVSGQTRSNRITKRVFIVLMSATILILAAYSGVVTETWLRGVKTLDRLVGSPDPVDAKTQFQFLRPVDVPEIEVPGIDCRALFRGSRVELKRAAAFRARSKKSRKSDAEYIELAADCERFTAERRYALQPANAEESDFPIAFSILMYKDVEQFERLVRAIYRPQNVYCVHVDAKSPKSLHKAVVAIVGCLRNVFLMYPAQEVVWGKFSVLEPELRCMEELLRRDKKWKYFINLTGQEWPLRNNWELVRILKAFNGSNNIDGTVKWRDMKRFADSPQPPLKLTVIKGSAHIVAVRGFVDFAIHSSKAAELLNWVRQIRFPDEAYFATLNHNPRKLRAPGAYLGRHETNMASNRFLARHKNWRPGGGYCGGKRIRDICIFGVRDLPKLAARPELFANKFHLDFQPLTLDCMEQLHYRRLVDQMTSLRAGARSEDVFNTSLYAKQQFTWNHL